MSYAALYEYCQDLPVPVSRSKIIPKVVELARRPRRPLVLLRTMDPATIAGFIVFPDEDADPAHPFVRWGRGEPVICVARSLNYCWQRFVVIKELMHYFDPPLEKVNTPEDFGALLTEFAAPQPDRSLAMNSEVSALWMALGIMCPEIRRQSLERRRAKGELTDLDIAQELKMPAAYVPLLFTAQYKHNIGRLCAG